MAKKPPKNKGKQAPLLNKGDEKMVKVRIRPYRGIGGVGGPGTETMMSLALAQEYARDGYLDILKEDES